MEHCSHQEKEKCSLPVLAVPAVAMLRVLLVAIIP